MRNATELLTAIERGETAAADELLPLVYNDLRRRAAALLAGERPGQTLQATALVHEAWLRLVREDGRKFENSRHFFCVAATAMRRILIDHARRKKAPKHGGHLHRVNLDDVSPAQRLPTEDLLALDAALRQLAEEDAEAAQLVELRFFVGLGHQEAARIMGLSRGQADGLWAYARAWLFEAVRTDLHANGASNSP